MIIGNYTKQPADTLDYDIDCSQWLIGSDSVQSAAVVIDGVGLVNDRNTISSKRVKVWLSGGTNGIGYKITVTITTDEGRIKQVEFKVKVKDY